MTTFPTRTTGTIAGRPPRTSAARPASAWAFAGGPLFLIQGIASIVLAVALVAFRRLVLLAAGAVLAAATAAGLLLSAGIGLFGYQESLAVPYAETSLVVEFTGAAVLAAAAAIVLAAPLLRRRS